ncbi:MULTISPECIES: SigB/SigF/SigG family RNA polymerase sigma factor [Streptomyces]|uniref:Probable sigma factor n=1 Tax=Streptomyces scabiei (strain 87.22) TaxID=680198 RepID=C9Z320_STRSW|nr:MULTISPECIES: SigB/SigF/SigG family RNA polymerase sigma factor [Streptomyces]MBP5933843.1 SigB/SigF/SigG family RNA polymerase sigma factor [Streptomyces sp. LBUM 1479]KFG04170.1 RNA polymerase sigma factor [Streptomyces scabiei]MBP5873538.1 SigB/SigF/SigG family RNA polymerase sigma factor [Streptomyces sp. LBUM 1477]MBP5881231.1 SigB/SigF/SigG family RNA polymerase sigma factor [Streptomyces sp. LBUM 1487]MBP5895896.1 SigB/SigF/SigG family RNA polymerase sigma factor [Streptomyces sp. LB
MLVNVSANGPVTSARPGTPESRRTHDDAPDTATAFARLAAMDPGPERDHVRDELVRAWLPMAHRIASRFRNRGESLEDLRQVAAMGLVKAVDRFEPERGAFESYAVPTITGEIKRHFRDRMWTLRVPRRVQDLRNKVRVARRELSQTSGGSAEPSVADIAALAGLTEEEVHAGMEALDSFSALSLDAEMASGDDGYNLADTLGAPDAAYDVVVDRESVKQGLSRLPERERAILYMRFFEDMTQNRIADRLGISQMHVSRLISRSCARVREEALGRTAPPS